MAEDPDQALILHLTNVLREFSDRQLEMLAVVRRLRTELTAPPSHTGHQTLIDRATVETRKAPLLLPSSVAQEPVTQEPVTQEPVAQEPGLTPTTAHDYDYFDELDARLARLHGDADPKTV